MSPSYHDSGEGSMAAYKCCFLRSNSAPMVQTIEWDLDGEAINHATSLLDAKPEHYSIEIWKDNRLLARIVKGVSIEQHHRTT
jgi:hypothetical protein